MPTGAEEEVGGAILTERIADRQISQGPKSMTYKDMEARKKKQ